MMLLGKSRLLTLKDSIVSQDGLERQMILNLGRGHGK